MGEKSGNLMSSEVVYNLHRSELRDWQTYFVRHKQKNSGVGCRKASRYREQTADGTSQTLITYLPHPQRRDRLTGPANATGRSLPDLPTPALPNMASLTSALLAMAGGDRV